MTKPPDWFFVVAVVALLWNAAGRVAILADLSLSPADMASLQGLVLVVGIALLFLARHAMAKTWIA